MRESQKGYGQAQNLNLAFTVGKFSSTEANYDEYDDYGTIKMYYEYWDNDQDVLIPVDTRPCTADDFQMDTTSPTANAKFFKADETKVNEFRRKMNILKCTKEPLNLIGNWNTGTA